MIKNELLEILACPETKQDIQLADRELIEEINAKIKSNTLKNRGGEQVLEPIEEGLVREDKAFLYPVRNDIPIMLIEEAIPLS